MTGLPRSEAWIVNVRVGGRVYSQRCTWSEGAIRIDVPAHGRLVVTRPEARPNFYPAASTDTWIVAADDPE